VGHVAHIGEGRDVYGVLVGMPEGKRPLGRPRRRWDDIYFKDVDVSEGLETHVPLTWSSD